MIQFTAIGTPAPKGSTKAFFRPGMRFPVVTEDNKHTRPWAAILRDAAIQASGDLVGFPTGTPVSILIRFVMPRPASLPKRVACHTKKPDVDKLTRCVLDSLKGVLWDDDSQVVMVSAYKEYVSHGEMPRAEVAVDEFRQELNVTNNMRTQEEMCQPSLYR